jgi:hypothetical protein
MDTLKLVEILKTLSLESLSLGNNPSEADLKALMNKYDMLFIGENFNKIYSVELAHSLNKIMNIDVTIDFLNDMVPNACSILKMKYEALINAKDVGTPNPKISCYQIELW